MIFTLSIHIPTWWEDENQRSSLGFFYEKWFHNAVIDIKNFSLMRFKNNPTIYETIIRWNMPDKPRKHPFHKLIICQMSIIKSLSLSILPGALLAISCKTDKRKGKSSWAKGSTDEYGDFIIYLPSHLHAIPNLDRSCLIRVLRLPKNSRCQPALTTKHRGIRFSSMGNGIRAYTAGNIRLNSKIRFSSRHSNVLWIQENGSGTHVDGAWSVTTLISCIIHPIYL